MVRLVFAVCCLLLTPWTALAQGVLMYGRATDSTFLDPAKFLDNESAKVIENIFDGLVRFKDDSTEVEPALAVAWENSADGLVWSFQLRKGVHFHDGTPFDAEAAAFSLRRVVDPDFPWYKKEYSRMNPALEVVDRVEAVDEHLLRLVLKEPYAPLLNVLATHSSYIVCPTAVKRLGDNFAMHPVGTGPFQFKKWIPGDSIVLTANHNYWNGRPHLEGVIFKAIPDHQQRLRELVIQNVQACEGLNPSDRKTLQQNPSIDLVVQPGLNVGYLAMNTQKPPFDNPAVRVAVNHAINTENLVKLLYQGLAIPAVSPLPPTLWGSRRDLPPHGYDPVEARRLLELGGVGQGFKTTLWYPSVPRPYLPEPRKIALAIQANLEAVGIHTELVTKPWTEYLTSLYNGEHDMALLGWNGTPDPDNFMSNLFASDHAIPPHASNIALFRSPRLDQLIHEARRAQDLSQRQQLYHIMQTIIHENAPWTPLAHAYQVLAHLKSVHGLVLHTTGVVRCHNAWLEK